MTSNPLIVSEAETFLRSWAAEATMLKENECLCCYVARMLDEFPCDGTLRHAKHYRDQRAPRATALAERLGRVGGYCDCEIFLNGYQLPSADEDGEADAEADWDDNSVLYVDDVLNDEPAREEWPPCQGVRRGTVQPCGNWVRIPRWR
jgi:hypothetical protein